VKKIKAARINKKTSSGISHHFFSWRKNLKASWQIWRTRFLYRGAGSVTSQFQKEA
jgi:hypothetical protein